MISIQPHLNPPGTTISHHGTFNNPQASQASFHPIKHGDRYSPWVLFSHNGTLWKAASTGDWTIPDPPLLPEMPVHLQGSLLILQSPLYTFSSNTLLGYLAQWYPCIYNCCHTVNPISFTNTPQSQEGFLFYKVLQKCCILFKATLYKLNEISYFFLMDLEFYQLFICPPSLL